MAILTPANAPTATEGVVGDHALLETFQDNIQILTKVSKTRLFNTVPVYNVSSTKNRWSLVDGEGSVEKTGRLVDTPYMEVIFSSRVTQPSEHHTAIPWELEDDSYTALANPKSAYAKLIAKAIKKQENARFIAAILGDAVDATGATHALPAANTFTEVPANGITFNGFNQLLIKANMNQIDTDMKRVFLINAEMLGALQSMEQFTSNDYNRRTLMELQTEGQVASWLGAVWILTEELPVAAGVASCIMYIPDGVAVQQPHGVITKASELPTKSYAKQIYARWANDVVRVRDDMVYVAEFTVA